MVKSGLFINLYFSVKKKKGLSFLARKDLKRSMQASSCSFVLLEIMPWQNKLSIQLEQCKKLKSHFGWSSERKNENKEKVMLGHHLHIKGSWG